MNIIVGCSYILLAGFTEINGSLLCCVIHWIVWTKIKPFPSTLHRWEFVNLASLTVPSFIFQFDAQEKAAFIFCVEDRALFCQSILPLNSLGVMPVMALKLRRKVRSVENPDDTHTSVSLMSGRVSNSCLACSVR